MASATTQPVTVMHQTFGERLIAEALRHGAPRQQEPLSAWFKEHHAIEVSAPMINKYKNRGALPRMDLCRDFAVALGVTVEWLYTGRGRKYPGPDLSPDDEEILRLLHAKPHEAMGNWYGYLKIALSADERPDAKNNAA